MGYVSWNFQNKGLCALYLFFFLFLIFPSLLSARTVSLVYDDSGSMLGKNKWSNANYAVQVLSALLRDTDKLFCVRMNGAKGGELFALESKQRKVSLGKIRAWPSPVDGAKTPYLSVETAARNLFELQGKSTRSLGMSDADWLIVVTDGEFHKTDNKLVQEQYYEKVAEHASSFFSTKEGRNIRIAFLLIGANADEKTAITWKNLAPASDQVIIFRSGSSDIAVTMEKIAQLIAGRDDNSIQPEISGKILRFSSIFPVSRFTIFEQDSANTLAEIVDNGVTLPNKNKSPDIRSFTIQTPGAKKVWGRTTHISTSEVMSAGEYSILFDRDISDHSLNLIVEPSVDFKVVALDADDHELPMDDSGSYKVCDNARIRFKVTFMSLRNGKWVDLPIGKKVASRLLVNATLSRKKLSFTYDDNVSGFLSKEVGVTEKRDLMQLEAKYPGYFHIKANAIPIERKDCEKNADFSLTDVVVPVHYSDTEIFDEVGSFILTRRGDKYEGNNVVSAPELPAGVRLNIQGNLLESDQDKLVLNLDSPVIVKILTNKLFTATESISFRLKIATDNPNVRITNSGEVVLKPQPRTLKIVPVAEQWSSGFFEVGRTAGPEYSVLVDGKKIKKDQLTLYKLSAITDKRINLQVVAVADENRYQLNVEPYFIKSLTEVGDVPVSLSLEGRLPGEKAELEVLLHIEKLSWWERLRWTLFVVLLSLFMLIWLIGCFRKNRFSAAAHVEYMEKKIGLSQRRRPTIFYLCATKSRKSKFFKIFLAYCWPFGAEKQGVEGMVFYANYDGNSILLSKGSQSPGMKAGTRKLTKNDSGKDNVMITSGEKITVTTNTYHKTYMFKNH